MRKQTKVLSLHKLLTNHIRKKIRRLLIMKTKQTIISLIVLLLLFCGISLNSIGQPRNLIKAEQIIKEVEQVATKAEVHIHIPPRGGFGVSPLNPDIQRPGSSVHISTIPGVNLSHSKIVSVATLIDKLGKKHTGINEISPQIVESSLQKIADRMVDYEKLDTAIRELQLWISYSQKYSNRVDIEADLMNIEISEQLGEIAWEIIRLKRINEDLKVYNKKIEKREFKIKFGYIINKNGKTIAA